MVVFFNFIELNAEAAQLNLIVNTSMNADGSLLCPRGQIPAVIGPQAVAGKEGLGRPVRQGQTPLRLTRQRKRLPEPGKRVPRAHSA